MKRRHFIAECREVKKRLKTSKYFIFNVALKYLISEAGGSTTKAAAKTLLGPFQHIAQNAPRSSHASFIKNSCLLTGQTGSINRFARLNRMQLKSYIERGLLIGARHPK